MSFSEILHLWAANTALSAVIWLLLVMTLLYAGRGAAHRAIISISNVFHQAMRLLARSFFHMEQSLLKRNREVLLAAGREAAEHHIEREFDRIDQSVKRDLAEYPALQRKVNELATKIEEDYQTCAIVPPTVPGWDKPIEAVAAIPSKGDPMVATVLDNIHEAMKASHTRALNEYRKNTEMHHGVLKKMLPYWRRVGEALQKLDANINSLLGRSQKIDRHMDEYEKILKNEDRSLRMLSSSSLTQFFISGFVLMIAIGGAIINFNLIAHPMQEMVGGSNYIMGFKTANIAALVIILVEVAMGLFLMESLRITHLFPVIGAMNDKMRMRMVMVTFGLLFVLASVESGLAYMREILAQDDAALRASLLAEQNAAAASAAAATSSRWITTAAQMGMGFILPFALTFVAIPMESFVHSLRTVLGLVGAVGLRGAGYTARVIGNFARHTGHTLIHIYDLLICIPLWIERSVKGRQPQSTMASRDQSKEAENIAEKKDTDTARAA